MSQPLQERGDSWRSWFSFCQKTHLGKQMLRSAAATGLQTQRCGLFCVTTDEPPGCPFSGRWPGELAHALALGGPHEFINYARRSSVEEDGEFEWPKMLLLNSIQILVPGIKQVREAKLKHKYALELAEHVCAALSPLSDSEIHEFLLKPATITIAASCGVVEIVELCLQMIPHFIWSYLPPTIDEFGNTILPLAEQLAHPSHLTVVLGAALQMQRELQWFKEVEKLVHPFVKVTRNTFGKKA
ncbi:Ankyrin repeat-containing protein family [Melia azedarach]|uniref:Ankyrin repeat-containing protein family n=1 Tax=Melia azedarach TaxID=155640 RepID=A0ACC1YX52_MELAZ|nr:Ankyrin repeat-containing protein family [Melia azedarach]